MQLDLLSIPDSDAAHRQLTEIARLVKTARPASKQSFQYQDGYRAAMRTIENVLMSGPAENLPAVVREPAGALYNPAVGFTISRNAAEVAQDMREATNDMADAFTEAFPTEDYTIFLRSQDFGDIIVVEHPRHLDPEEVTAALKIASRCRPFFLEAA